MGTFVGAGEVTTVVVGPNITIDGLIVYFDVSNPQCVSQTLGRNIMANLVPDYPNIQAKQTGSAPQLVNAPNSVRYFRFNGINNHFYYTVPITPTFTAITIVKSNTPVWQCDNGIGTQTAPFVASGGANGFKYQGLNGLPPFGASGYQEAWSTVQNSIGTTDFNLVSPVANVNSFLTQPGMYTVSSDGAGSNKSYVGDLLICSATSPAWSGTRTSGNIPVWIATDDKNEYPTSRWANISFYAHLLFNRQLSDNEVAATYYALQSRYNLFSL